MQQNLYIHFQITLNIWPDISGDLLAQVSR